MSEWNYGASIWCHRELLGEEENPTHKTLECVCERKGSVCVCVCVCVREREREQGENTGNFSYKHPPALVVLQVLIKLTFKT